ncbi:membrane protein [Oceanobacillus oncorhynchi subsp. incaldanensis]|uniref:DUF423 domain-containing protein n=1 Tax=Oceanobacillus oncorhynchi TaxID=545501 RepID=A0A0A1MLZ1_9BACI|nr:DUF423 domain-containing protein [Oceanobacillus oncorhynchi]MDM8098881.1 DUF423 domain-containing protein [Oceanobacillus oncorhynchi]UUI39663.1 DUF423 domain-containing protein [Oceanobacillus oncorhynchi]GIO19064.1 membrane protein [Oceanobacillus oncorhynchi subsp. incaldanensis]CEI80702.1 hypothetical protein BN997_00511 [Oceanobacillus oncorhynchi]
MKLFLIIGAILGFLAVAFGAFGAHGLEGRLSERALTNWGKAVDYQMFHTVAIVAVALLLGKFEGSSLFASSGWLFLTGIILFSGSLYIYALTGVKALAMITPIGGLAFLAGWVLLGIGAMKLV